MIESLLQASEIFSGKNWMTKSVHGILSVAAMLVIIVNSLARVGVAAEPSLPAIQVQSLTLPNGMRALFEEDHDLPVVTVEVWYHVGSKNEAPGQSGFAHFFEHLMFDGTVSVGPGQFSSYIIRAGGGDNAYTTQDVTVFWETVPSVALPQVLWLEADRMRNLNITEKQFDNERQIVGEERRMRFDNPPYGTAIESLYALSFKVHPYHHLPIGSTEDLDRASVGAIKNFYDTYYVPENATLLVVGDFKTEELQDWIRQYFGPIAAGGRKINREIPPEPPQKSERAASMTKNVNLPAFIEGYRMPADGTPDSYPLELLVKLLSDGQSSLIYRSLVYDKQMAVEAQADADFAEDPNLFFVLAIMNSGYTVAQGEAAMREIFDRLKTHLLSAQELERAKNQAFRDWVVGRETTRGRAEQLGEDGVILDDPELVNTEINRILAVTPQDIQAVARKYFVPSNLSRIEIVPGQAGHGSSAGNNSNAPPAPVGWHK
jgi:zinc protease